MTIEAERIDTITFDMFSTIVDVIGTTNEKLGEYVDDVAPISVRWRTRAVDYRMVGNFVDEYQPFDETVYDAMEYALRVFDTGVTPDEVEDIFSSIYELDPFDDVYENMEWLHDQGYDLYISTNGNPELVYEMVQRAEISPFLEDTISADEIEVYKPAKEFYEHTAERTDTPIKNILHVSAPWYDIYGAMNAGMQGAWVNRQRDPWESFFHEPDEIVHGFDHLVEVLDE